MYRLRRVPVRLPTRPFKAFYAAGSPVRKTTEKPAQESIDQKVNFPEDFPFGSRMPFQRSNLAGEFLHHTFGILMAGLHTLICFHNRFGQIQRSQIDHVHLKHVLHGFVNHGR